MKFKKRTVAVAATVLVALAIPAYLAGQQNLEPNKGHARYKFIDLGTFGGPASYITNGYDGILNNRGTAAGWADMSTPDPYPDFCFNPDCMVSHAFALNNGALTDLGVLPGGASSSAWWTSSNGLILGNSQNGRIDPLAPGLPENRAVVWYNSRIVDLGTLEGGHESFGYSVNSHGQAVGLAFNTVPDPFSFFGSSYPYQGRAFLWQNGAMWDLGTLGGPDAQASFVNERGQVTGQSYTNSTPNPTTGIPTTDPFFWENGRMLDIGTLGGTYGNPLAFNNLGQVVGTSNMPGDIDFHPFLWSKSRGIHDLGTLGGPTGEVSWINDAGDAVGKADLPVNNHDAVLWKNGMKTDLGTVPGDVCSFAYFVNLRGQVVGTSEDQESCDLPTGQHAFLWEHGGPMVDLNTLIPSGSSLQLVFAFAINESGEIIGAGVPPGCAPQDYSTCGHAYVLIPCAAGDATGDARCQAESPAATTGLSPAMATQRPATVTPPSRAVSGRGMLDRVRARYSQRHPGF